MSGTCGSLVLLVVFCCSLLPDCLFVFCLFFSFLLFVSSFHFSFFLVCLETVVAQSDTGSEDAENTWDVSKDAADAQGYPIVDISTSHTKNGWVAKGRLKFKRGLKSKTKLINIRYPHQRKVFICYILFLLLIITSCLFHMFITGI